MIIIIIATIITIIYYHDYHFLPWVYENYMMIAHDL